MSAEFATIIVFSIIGIIYFIAILVLFRLILISKHYVKALALVDKSATRIEHNCRLARGGWKPVYRLMDKYPTPDTMVYKLHKWTYQQFYAGLEDDLEEIENQAEHEDIMNRVRS